MFWLIILMLATGGPRIAERPVLFSTFQACEVARVDAAPRVRALFPQVEVVAYCVCFENDARNPVQGKFSCDDVAKALRGGFWRKLNDVILGN